MTQRKRPGKSPFSECLLMERYSLSPRDKRVREYYGNLGWKQPAATTQP
jgi:hypothetical protein